MKMFLVLAGLVLAVSLAHGGEECPVLCGKQGDGLECPNNQCCSAGGRCGLGDDYCGDNCQSGPCFPSSRKHRCGKRFGNKKCTNNYCCSGDGFCGLGVASCSIGGGCQSGFCWGTPCSETKGCTDNQCCSSKGMCGVGHLYCGHGCKGGPCYYPPYTVADASSTKSPSPTPKCQNRCGRQNGDLECPNNQCCSEDGKCGLEENHCGAGCQSGPCHPSQEQRCGVRYGKRKCSNNYCCSGDGYCGVGPEYCHVLTCQIDYGICAASYCSSSRSPGTCDNNFCCQGVLCGLGPAFCGYGCKNGPCYYALGTHAAATANASASASALPVGSSSSSVLDS